MGVTVTMKLLSAITLIITFSALDAKIYNRCDLAYEMIHSHGFAKGSIDQWICLVANGSGDAAKYNDCNVNCSSLTNSNISDDCTCAKLIYKRHGFDAWYGWQKGCKGKDCSSYISGCKL